MCGPSCPGRIPPDPKGARFSVARTCLCSKLTAGRTTAGRGLTQWLLRSHSLTHKHTHNTQSLLSLPQKCVAVRLLVRLCFVCFLRFRVDGWPLVSSCRFLPTLPSPSLWIVLMRASSLRLLQAGLKSTLLRERKSPVCVYWCVCVCVCVCEWVK